jgi:hypothetical protein
VTQKVQGSVWSCNGAPIFGMYVIIAGRPIYMYR